MNVTPHKLISLGAGMVSGFPAGSDWRGASDFLNRFRPPDEYVQLILLSVALVLTIYLYARFRRRARNWPEERQWPGHGIDTRGVSQRVQRLRHDYVSELHLSPYAICKRKGLIATARRTVGRLPYFRLRGTHGTVDADQEETHAA